MLTINTLGVQEQNVVDHNLPFSWRSIWNSRVLLHEGYIDG